MMTVVFYDNGITIALTDVRMVTLVDRQFMPADKEDPVTKLCWVVENGADGEQLAVVASDGVQELDEMGQSDLILEISQHDHFDLRPHCAGYPRQF